MEGNIRLNQNNTRELQLGEKALQQRLSPREAKELQTLKSARSPVPFPQSVVKGGLSPRELGKLEKLSTQRVLSPRESKEYENLVEKRRTNTLQAREIIGENIAKEMAEGKSQSQSVAIALSEARRAGLDIPYAGSPRSITQSSKLPYPVY